MRVVLDTNVLISFLLTKSSTISKVLQSWKENKFVLLVSSEILLEIENVFLRFVEKQLIQDSEAEIFLRRIKKKAIKIKISSEVNLSKDKKDNRYLACSKDGKADYLVTGDKKHLLSLKKFARTEIISPAEFIEALSQKKL